MPVMALQPQKRRPPIPHPAQFNFILNSNGDFTLKTKDLCTYLVRN